MASQKLQTAWNYYTSKNEGGWTKDPNDIGNSGTVLGTYCGITQKNYPTWCGWSVLVTKTYRLGAIFPELNGSVLEFYDKEYWTPLRAEEINDTGISSILFDTSVNKGMVTGIEETQQACGIAPTGHMDDATINGINNPTV